MSGIQDDVIHIYSQSDYLEPGISGFIGYFEVLDDKRWTNMTIVENVYDFSLQEQ